MRKGKEINRKQGVVWFPGGILTVNITGTVDVTLEISNPKNEKWGF